TGQARARRRQDRRGRRKALIPRVVRWGIRAATRRPFPFPRGVTRGQTIPDLRLVSALAASFALCAPLPATEIVRCTTREGEVRYQGRPCDRGEATKTIEHADDVPGRDEARPPAEPESVVPARAAATTRAIEADPAVPTVAPAWVCRREDGTRYLSESGFGER